LKFGISVFGNDRVLSKSDAQKKLERLIRQMRLESCINALKKLTTAENNPILTGALEYYQNREYLTPKFAYVVLWLLQKNNIDHSPSSFKINLRRDQFKEDLQNMRRSHVHVIWPALSSGQREIAVRLGHTAPNAA
jgi:hypothetical protein